MSVKLKQKGKYIIIAVAIFLAVVFYSLHVSHYIASSFEDDKSTQVEETLTMGGFAVDSSLPTAPKTEKNKQNIDYMSAMIGAFDNISEHPFDLKPIGHYFWAPFGVSSLLIFIVIAYIWSKKEFEREDAAGKEEGSAKWNTDPKKFSKKYTANYNPQRDPFDHNAILAKGLKLNLDNKTIERNLNMFVLGGPGTGKSFKLIKPNMAQMNSSCIITDPKGELFECMAKPLIDRGIKVKLFSTADMVNSNCYNPFDYIYNEKGEVDEEKVSTMIYLYLKNANGAKQKSSGDPFWEKSAKAFIAAEIYYLLESDVIRKEDRNFSTVLKLTQMGKIDDDGGSSQSKLDILMEAHRTAMAEKGIESKALTNYDTFKLAPAKTANSILITCAVDMQIFDNKNVKNLTRTDYKNDRNNVHLEKLGDEQTYLFINIPAANETFNFLVAMLYSQMFATLYNKIEKIYPNKYMIVDEFGYPVVTMFDSKEDAKHAIEVIKAGKKTKVTTVSNAVYYQIKDGKNVILEKSSKEALNNIIASADKFTIKKGGIRMPWHVRCLMDEFANIAEIPDFGRYLSTMRSYEISCTIVIQALAQLKDKYDKRWEEIIADCDTFIFLGATDNESCEYVSKKLGDATVRVRNLSYSKKSGTSSSYSPKKRPLLTPQEVGNINNNGQDKCIVMIRDIDPFLADKVSFLDHPNFGITGNASRDNILSQEEVKVFFNSTPLSKEIYSELKKQKSLLETAGKSRMGDGEHLLDDITGEKDVDLSKLEDNFTPISPSDVNKENQDKMAQGENPIKDEEQIKEETNLPTSKEVEQLTEDGEKTFFF